VHTIDTVNTRQATDAEIAFFISSLLRVKIERNKLMR